MGQGLRAPLASRHRYQALGRGPATTEDELNVFAMPESKFDQAKFDKLVQGKSWLLRGFVFYAKAHWDPINQWIHIFCVWPILFTAITLFAHIELPDAVMQHVPQNIIDASPVRIGNAGFVLAMLYFVWHFLLSIPIGFAANLLVVACLLGADYWHATAPADVTTYAWGVHIACWIAQFYGHGVHEHRRPALLENLFASTFMAPIFVVIEILCKLGFLADFHRDMSAVVEPEVRAFHAARLGKKEA